MAEHCLESFDKEYYKTGDTVISFHATAHALDMDFVKQLVHNMCSDKDTLLFDILHDDVDEN